jgi:cobyrinic acid a,c-diamide synthase
MAIPRLVIAAPQGRSGKTTATLGLCAALAGRGLAVQPFKKGPDYIDPSWLSEAAGRPCRSLDPFFCGDDERLIAAFLAGAAGADIAIVEGNHGLYDGVAVGQGSGVRNQGSGVRGQESAVGGGDPASDVMLSGSTGSRALRQDASEASQGAFQDDESFGSTAAVARALAAPILLVVNAARMGRTAAAIVHGCQTFEPGTPIAGVILNNVARGRHEAKLRAAVEYHCGIPVVGALPRDEALSIPDRHLGLIPRGEDAGLLPALAACRAAAERHFDLDAILTIARDAPPVGAGLASLTESRCSTRSSCSGKPAVDAEKPAPTPQSAIRNTHHAVHLALFRDRAFTFYYGENLEALADAGAELVFVDAFRDAALPPVDGLVIGGGFPEMFMDELSANAGLRASVRAAAEAGLPIYAECGGLMYLARRIIWGERSAEMAGVLPYDVEMTGRPQGHGYVETVVDAPNPFFPLGTVLRGHEFHNSLLRTAHSVGHGAPTAYHLNRGNGIGGGRDGLVYRNVLAAYTHLHIAGAPVWASALVERARRFSTDRNATGDKRDGY